MREIDHFANLLTKKAYMGYVYNMTNTAILIREIETMPEETVVEVLDFAMFLKERHTHKKEPQRKSLKDAYGIFKGIDTHFDRDEDDRV